MSALCQQNMPHHVATGCFLHLLHHFQGSHFNPLPQQRMEESTFVVRVFFTSLETNRSVDVGTAPCVLIVSEDWLQTWLSWVLWN